VVLDDDLVVCDVVNILGGRSHYICTLYLVTILSRLNESENEQVSMYELVSVSV
jgi:hypothetical protein